MFLLAIDEYITLTSKDVEKGYAKDLVKSKVILHTLNGWRNVNYSKEIKPYFLRRNELSFKLGCLSWGSHVVIPPKLRAYCIE